MEILTFTNPPVIHRIFWKGQGGVPDNTPVVRVYDVVSDPTGEVTSTRTLLTTLTSEMVETDIGVYQIYIPMAYTTTERELALVWSYSIEGTNINKEDKLFIVKPYVDVTQAISELDIGMDPSDPNYKSYSELVAAEKYARKVIEGYTGQQFFRYYDSHTILGDGTDILPMPYRVAELKEVYINDVLVINKDTDLNNFGATVQVSESRFALRINRASAVDNIIYVANGMVPPSVNDSTGRFTKGTSYRVEAYFGWDEVPDEVEVAAIELMKDYFSKDKIWRNKYLHSVQSFDWHFEYNTGAYIGTGNLYVDQLLLPYVLTQMVLI